MRRNYFWLGVVAVAAGFFLLGSAALAEEPRPPGVSCVSCFPLRLSIRRVSKSQRTSPRSIKAEELKEAWRKKALLMAKGQKFKSSPLVVHDNEVVGNGVYWPLQSRSVTGSITLTE